MPDSNLRNGATIPIASVTDASFEADVLQAPLPVLVDFSADWCAPCKVMHEVLAELSVEYDDRLRIVTVDVDQNPGFASQLGVRGMPSLFLFREGAIVGNRAGAAPKAAIRRWIDDVIRRT